MTVRPAHAEGCGLAEFLQHLLADLGKSAGLRLVTRPRSTMSVRRDPIGASGRKIGQSRPRASASSASDLIGAYRLGRAAWRGAGR